jgi:hypothetical protein
VTRQRTLTTALAAGLLAVSLALPLSGVPTPAHAQAPAAGLARGDLAAFVVVLPAVQQCNTDLDTVAGDLQQASDNPSAGDTDMGSLRSDATRMRNDCLAAATRVNRLHFAAGAAHTAARRVKSELHAALVDHAQGAYDCTRFVDDLTAGDGSAAMVVLRQGTSAWTAATAHMRVAMSYIH